MEVPKQRAPLALAFGEPIQLTVQAVCDVACGATGRERIRRAIQDRPVLANEVLPRPFVSSRAGAREGEVFEMQ
jgi:hypothetical protein